MYQTEIAPAQADLFDDHRNVIALFGTDAGPRHPAAADSPVVAVIDDDGAARESLAWLLGIEGYRVISFASGDAFLAARPAERPACVLLDLRMPGRSGLDVLRALAARGDSPPVIMLTGDADLSTAVAAMKLKAMDFIQKPCPPEALLAALAGACARYEQSRAARAAAGEARARLEALSERQRQVLAGIVDGRANKVIAWELGLSVRTVEAYRAQLFERLGARTTADAVRIALAGGVGESAAAAPRRAA